MAFKIKRPNEKGQKLLRKWLKQEKWSVLISSVGNALLSLSAIFFSLGSKEIIDAAIAVANKKDSADRLIGSAVFLVGITVFIIIMRVLLSNVSQITSARMANSIRQELLSGILKKDYSEIAGYHSGELVNRAFSDVNIISGGVTGLIPPLCGMIVKLVSSAVVLWIFDWRYTVVMFAIGILIMLGSFMTKRTLKGMHKEVQKEQGVVHAVFQEILGNLKFVKASGSQEHMESLAKKNQDSYYKVQMRRKRFMLIFEACYGTVMELGWLLTLIWGAFSISSNLITYGTLTAMMQLMGQMQSPLASIPTLLQRFYGISASAERIEELLELPDEAAEEFSLCEQEPPLSIGMNKLSFSYDRNPVLENVDGVINRGDFVAITGLSGGGKSTLFLLLLGIYRPVSGEISINFEDLTVNPCAATRVLFSYVPQGNALFSGTIRENLLMFKADATQEMLLNAAKIACIDSFIEELPEKLDTRIGERGLGLSEGQAQRLAIARAIVGNAPILLLDEATSALDEQTEAQLLKNLEELSDLTLLIVTHRRAALAICNKRLNIEDGVAKLEALNEAR